MARVVELSVDGAALEVSRLTGTVALSCPYELSADVFAQGGAPLPGDLLGKPYELVLTDGFGAALPVRGVVLSAVRHVGDVVEGARLELTLGSPVAALTIGRDSRVFQEMTVVELVKKVLERGEVTDVEWRTSAAYAKRPYTAQYRESDWDFVQRLLDEEGIYYWFEHEGGATKLVFGDDSTGAAPIDGGAELSYRDDALLLETEGAVYRVTKRAAVAHEAVRLRDYNHEKPRLRLDEKAGSGARELYDFPGRFAVPGDGERRAQVRLESLRARRVVVAGETTTTRLRVGRTFDLAEHPVEGLDGGYLVERVTYIVSDQRGASAGESEPVRLAWVAIPKATPYRAPRRGPVTRDPAGPETGVVAGAPGEEIHPDKAGRVRVQFYWDREGQRDDKASTWMRVGQFALGGSMVLPRVGWDVLAHHAEGDIDSPYVSAHLYDGRFPVPYGLPGNKTRTAWQTATTPGGGSSNEIRFEDKKGSEEIFINASKDMNVVVGDNRMEKVGVDLEETIGANLDVKVGSNRKVGVKSNQDVTIGAAESLTVSGGRSVVVGGSEATTVGASRSVTAIMGSSLDAKGGRTVTIGGTMMAISALGVNRLVLGTANVTVGGAWVSAAATGLATLTGGACAETVGGAKINAGAAGCAVSVKGAAAETVGGAYVIAAGSNVGESATSRLAFTVGGAMLANAPTIEIEAESEISFRVGGASLTIKPSSVEVKAPAIAAPGATITKKASKIEHNG
ncbi:type VI secretion system tip protein TssI/VgrG [Sorangium sp. So ce764]|uniref:type VI secretion system Vgr family protein n=1 Tax=Sorangium sp. So ce764 TaxID=3133320 RepID=UPI003F5E2D17